MWFINNIVSYCSSISSFFYSIYSEVYSWGYPFWYAANPFWYIHDFFAKLAWAFNDFGQWVDYITDKILTILNWAAIKWYILGWLPKLEDAVNWFLNRWYWFQNEVTAWWSNTSLLVQSWIDAAGSWLQSQINTLNSLLTSLQSQINYLLGQLPSINEIIAWWSNWWSFVLAQIISWGALTALQIQSLIDSVIREYAPFWEGWQDWKDSVIEFFTDPEDWLYKAVDRIFERFW